MPREVVVTGLGLMTPVGNNVSTAWENLVAGRSGIGLISQFDTSAYDYPIAGEVKNFEPSEFVNPKLLRRVDRSTQFAIAACQEAVADAGIEVDREQPGEIGRAHV